MDCWVARAVLLSEPILSSSRIEDTVCPELNVRFGILKFRLLERLLVVANHLVLAWSYIRPAPLSVEPTG